VSFRFSNQFLTANTTTGDKNGDAFGYTKKDVPSFFLWQKYSGQKNARKVPTRTSFMEHAGVTTVPRSSIVFWRSVFEVMKG